VVKEEIYTHCLKRQTYIGTISYNYIVTIETHE